LQFPRALSKHDRCEDCSKRLGSGIDPNGLLFVRISHYNEPHCREVAIMANGLIILLVFIGLVIVYTIAKVIAYMRESEQQWEQVDKSKLKEWEDDEDW